MIENCCILITTRNRHGILAETLARLYDAGLGNCPLFIYDDCSDEPLSRDRLETNWPVVQLFRGDDWRGQAHGRNVLLRACANDYALVLDDDQYFLSLGNLSRFTSLRRGDESPAVVSFARISKRTGERDIPADVGARYVSVFQGGTALFHVRSVLAVGGFRDFWGFGYEEPELSLRLFAAGKRIWYEPSILMEHNQFYCPEESRNTELYDYLYARNAILLSTMNMPLWYGISEGLVRSLRRSLLFRRNPRAKLRGTAAGIGLTWRRRQQRSPLPMDTIRAWRRFRNHELDDERSPR